MEKISLALCKVGKPVTREDIKKQKTREDENSFFVFLCYYKCRCLCAKLSKQHTDVDIYTGIYTELL
jgi:hypothetical protein